MTTGLLIIIAIGTLANGVWLAIIAARIDRNR